MRKTIAKGIRHSTSVIPKTIVRRMAIRGKLWSLIPVQIEDESISQIICQDQKT